MSFPLTKDEVKRWVWSALGGDEKKSAEVIVNIIEQHEIDGKLLVLLYKYPHEFVTILPEFRARLLLMNALDILIKSVGKNLPSYVKTCNFPTSSLLSRLANIKYSDSPHSFNQKMCGFDFKNVNNKSSTYLIEKQMYNDSKSFANESRESDDREIPSPIPLPIFDIPLQQAIKAGRLRERCIRSRIANACARFYSSIKMYPSLMDYHRICERLVEKYPDLGDNDIRAGFQPYNQLKKLLSVSFCNVRRIMKVKDLMNARHFITSMQNRYKSFGNDQPFTKYSTKLNQIIDDSSDSSDEEFPSQRKILLPSPPPIPTFDVTLEKAIVEGKLKERPWSSQFYRRCAKFYTKVKPYLSRSDYKNISQLLAKVFPCLGTSNSIKRLLSQHIRSYRQTRKLWKLDQQQKAKMLQIEKSKKIYQQTGRSCKTFEHKSNVSYLHRNTSRDSTVYGNAHLIPGCNKYESVAVDSSDDKKISLSLSSLHYPVPIPQLDENMIKAIREGQLQERALRIRFIRVCANFYLGLKSYPTKEDYNNICRTIITEFPDLRDPSPLPGCPPFMLFKKALTACIRNKRRDNVSSTAKQSNCPSTSSNNYIRSDNKPKVNGILHNSQSNTLSATSDQTRYNFVPAFPCFPGRSTQLSLLTDDIPNENQPNRHDSSSGHQCESFSDHQKEYATFNNTLLDSNFTTSNNFMNYQISLPSFTPDVSELLNNGQPPNGDSKFRFLQACTDFYFNSKISSDENHINGVCLQLIQAFPQLADDGSTLQKPLSFNSLKKDIMAFLNNDKMKSIEKPTIKLLPSDNLNGLVPVCSVPTETSFGHLVGSLNIQGAASVVAKNQQMHSITI